MQQVARWVLVVTLFTLGLRPSVALADTAGGLRFTVPAGWDTADQNGVRIVAPPDQKKGEMVVAMVVGTQAATGGPDDQVAAFAAMINTDAKIASASETLTTDRGTAGKLYIKNFQVENAELGKHIRMICLLVRGDQRSVLLILIANNAVLKKHGAAIQALLGSLEIDPNAPRLAPVAPTAPATVPDARPTAEDTPSLYMGMPGWKPSGRGAEIPAPRVVKGRPQGMWWRYQADMRTMFPLLMVYLPDGTHATNPRFGSGSKVDIAAQRKQQGSTGVGTFSVKDGSITQAADGHSKTDTFKSGTDKDGAWFEIGAGRHYPLEQISAKELVGAWKSSSSQFVFHADGTYETGTVVINSEVTATQAGRGRYRRDGYLLSLTSPDGSEYTTSVGRTGTFLIVGTTVLSRK